MYIMRESAEQKRRKVDLDLRRTEGEEEGEKRKRGGEPKRALKEGESKETKVRMKRKKTREMRLRDKRQPGRTTVGKNRENKCTIEKRGAFERRPLEREETDLRERRREKQKTKF